MEMIGALGGMQYKQLCVHASRERVVGVIAVHFVKGLKIVVV
jgi:hypothetical protein